MLYQLQLSAGSYQGALTGKEAGNGFSHKSYQYQITVKTMCKEIVIPATGFEPRALCLGNIRDRGY